MMDPVSLVRMILPVALLIVRAAETAQQNKKECLDLAQRAGTLANVLPNYTYAAAANDLETARVLRTLKEALDEAFALIQSCQTVSIFSRGRKAAKLDGVNGKINDCITDLKFIRDARTNHADVAAASSLPPQTYNHGFYYQAQGGGAYVGFPPPHHATVNVHVA